MYRKKKTKLYIEEINKYIYNIRARTRARIYISVCQWIVCVCTYVYAYTRLHFLHAKVTLYFQNTHLTN